MAVPSRVQASEERVRGRRHPLRARRHRSPPSAGLGPGSRPGSRPKAVNRFRPTTSQALWDHGSTARRQPPPRSPPPPSPGSRTPDRRLRRPRAPHSPPLQAPPPPPAHTRPPCHPPPGCQPYTGPTTPTPTGPHSPAPSGATAALDRQPCTRPTATSPTGPHSPHPQAPPPPRPPAVHRTHDSDTHRPTLAARTWVARRSPATSATDRSDARTRERLQRLVPTRQPT